MGAFWGGFAAKGVEYIDEARKNALDKTKLDDARKYESTEWDRRNSINRKEKLEDDTLNDMRDNYFKPERITKDADGKYWFSKMAQDANGNWAWTREEASAAQAKIADDEAKASSRKDKIFDLEVEGKVLSNQRTRQSMSLDASQERRARESHALEMKNGGKGAAGEIDDVTYDRAELAKSMNKEIRDTVNRLRRVNPKPLQPGFGEIEVAAEAAYKRFLTEGATEEALNKYRQAIDIIEKRKVGKNTQTFKNFMTSLDKFNALTPAEKQANTQGW